MRSAGTSTGQSTEETLYWYSKSGVALSGLYRLIHLGSVSSSSADKTIPPLQRAVNKFTKALIKRFLQLFVYFITDEQRKARRPLAIMGPAAHCVLSYSDARRRK